MVWRRFLPAIDPLIQAARGKPAVRSDQYLPNQGGTVKFGRLGWKEADHQKWSHGSPANKGASKSWSFLHMEFWAPAWTVCERENLAPDVYLDLANEALGGGYRQKLRFNPVVIFAVVSELARRMPEEVSAVVSALRNLTSAKFVGYRRRPWGKTCGAGAFTDSIQDLAVSGLFKPGPRHQGKFGFHLLTGKWKPVPANSETPNRQTKAKNSDGRENTTGRKHKTDGGKTSVAKKRRGKRSDR
jgi:hypothetical protein